MIDCHIHYSKSAGEERFINVIKKHALEAVALQCIPKGGVYPVENEALEFKRNCPVPVYVFGGISWNVYSLARPEMARALPAEIDRLTGMGCTGIKMLEGKPSVRKKCPVPDFDDPVWDAYWAKLEDAQIPLLFHVNDPEEFWDLTMVSEYAKKVGWYYDNTYINNEEQYRQVLAVLEKHPRLRVVFAHFFFLSKQLERLGNIFDAYPNVRVDLTPGIELFLNLSDSIDESRAFFTHYQDRILFGTDIGSSSIIDVNEIPLSYEESDARVDLVRNFISSREDYTLEVNEYFVHGEGTKRMHALKLPEEAQRKIFGENFFKFIG